MGDNPVPKDGIRAAGKGEAIGGVGPEPRRSQLSLAAKRAIDILSAGSALIVLSPLLLMIALLVKATSRGPILYRWRVLGKASQPFTGYKFRTMVHNAEELKTTLMDRNEMTGPVFKLVDDPRVTRIGRLLRKFSLDELPQLWSVVKGDMSLVGPRPVAPEEWRKFEPWQRRKLSVTPGMICLWHVRGKPRDFERWIRLDLEYIDTWSLRRDLALIAQSLWYMASGRNY